MKNAILAQLNAACPWRDTLYWYDTIDSTNTHAKALARQGAPHGTVLIAGAQTDGRGRMGRSFVSQAGKGVYLSVILRPACPPEQLMHLTCAAGVAMCDAVERVAGFRPGIKWINDLVFQKRKLGGILTEMAVNAKTRMVDHAVVGIGINCTGSPEDFPAPLRELAGSLSMFGAQPADTAVLAAAMIEALYKMDTFLHSSKAQLMARYRTDCITLGQEVAVHQGERIRYGTAVNVEDDGALTVIYPDGTKEHINSGEVSVRGLYGYV